mmetsp:Transcript_15370/g.22620  ORF Transcript_15370/g.22620 Transcript_15370/m.22620 type:complete len:203 (+) Transcript_15370:125-733(+)
MNALEAIYYLPLFADTSSTSLTTPSTPTSFWIEPGWVKRCQVDARALSIEYQFGHCLTAGRCPCNAPTIMSSIDKGTLISRYSAHVGHGIRWTGPHASLNPIQFSIGTILRRHFAKRIRGGIHPGWVGVAFLSKRSRFQFFFRDVVRPSNSAQVDGTVGPWVNFQMSTKTVILATKQCGSVHLILPLWLLPYNRRALNALHR